MSRGWRAGISTGCRRRIGNAPAAGSARAFRRSGETFDTLISDDQIAKITDSNPWRRTTHPKAEMVVPGVWYIIAAAVATRATSTLVPRPAAEHPGMARSVLPNRLRITVF